MTLQIDMPIDIKRQLTLALRALEATLPYADEAGVLTDYLTAYDEWEAITEAFYTAFLILPLCNGDESLRWAPHQFQRLGFEFEQKNLGILALYQENTFALFDFVKGADSRMFLMLRSLAAGNNLSDACVLPEDCNDFRVGALINC